MVNKATSDPQTADADQGFSLVAAELEIAQFWQRQDIFRVPLEQTADALGEIAPATKWPS